jgi:hypothetical protein
MGLGYFLRYCLHVSPNSPRKHVRIVLNTVTVAPAEAEVKWNFLQKFPLLEKLRLL